MAEPRTAKQVIDQAIRDNRRWEVLCFVSAAALLLIGVAVVGRAIVADQSNVVTVVGGLMNLLVWPTLRMGQRIRKENMAMRLLEVPLGKATTEQAAADMLRDMFVQIFVNSKG